MFSFYRRLQFANNPAHVNTLPRSLRMTSQDEWAEMQRRVAEGLEAGWMTPVVDKTYPLEQVGLRGVTGLPSRPVPSCEADPRLSG